MPKIQIAVKYYKMWELLAEYLLLNSVGPWNVIAIWDWIILI